VARRIQAEPTEFSRKLVGKSVTCLTDGNNVSDIGISRDNSALSPEDIYQELDGATILSTGAQWRLSVWGIHQIGADRWIQMAVEAPSGRHELVLHMSRASRGRDALTSIDQWLGSPFPPSNVIHVF